MDDRLISLTIINQSQLGKKKDCNDNDNQPRKKELASCLSGPDSEKKRKLRSKSRNIPTAPWGPGEIGTLWLSVWLSACLSVSLAG